MTEGYFRLGQTLFITFVVLVFVAIYIASGISPLQMLYALANILHFVFGG